MHAVPAPAKYEADPEIRAEVERSLDKWKDKEGNLIMILHEIQNNHGFVPREVCLELSMEMGVPMARIYEVLTFYHYFKLVAPGEHNVVLCNGTACYLKGSGNLLRELETRLGILDGETTADQRVHLETVRCIGCCGMAPAMVVDGETIGRVEVSRVEEILDTIRSESEATDETN